MKEIVEAIKIYVLVVIAILLFHVALAHADQFECFITGYSQERQVYSYELKTNSKLRFAILLQDTLSDAVSTSSHVKIQCKLRNGLEFHGVIDKLTIVSKSE